MRSILRSVRKCFSSAADLLRAQCHWIVFDIKMQSEGFVCVTSIFSISCTQRFEQCSRRKKINRPTRGPKCYFRPSIAVNHDSWRLLPYTAWACDVLETVDFTVATRNHAHHAVPVAVIFGGLQAWPQGQHCSKIMKPPQSLPLQIAERLLELSSVSYTHLTLPTNREV